MDPIGAGTNGLKLSRVIHGCMGFAPEDATATIRTIHAAIDAGTTSFDTAPLYGFGASEELLGKAIAGRREQVQILTKIGLRWDREHGQPLFDFVDAKGVRKTVRRNSRPESVRAEVESSLLRLGIETIDLLHVHHPDGDTPFADTMSCLLRLKEAGKIRAIGLSNFSRTQLGHAHSALGSGGLFTVQDEYNLLQRRIEEQILPWARSHDVGLLAYSPLAQGVLAGRQLKGGPVPADWRGSGPYYRAANLALAHNAITNVAAPLAHAHNATVGQICLAWLLGQPGVMAVIAGARTAEQAIANAGAGRLRVADRDLGRLELAFRGGDFSQPPIRMRDRILRKAGRIARRLLKI